MRRTDLLVSLGINPEAARFYRARLDCVVPYNRRVVNAKIERLARLLKKVEEAQMKANTLAAELEDLGVNVPIWDGGLNPSPTGTFQWNPFKNEWGYEKPPGISPRYGDKLLEDYSARPEKREAIDVWNRFVVAFERTPLRLFRRKGETFEIEFHDAQQRLIRFWDACLTQPLDKHAPPLPLHEFMASLCASDDEREQSRAEA